MSRQPQRVPFIRLRGYLLLMLGLLVTLAGCGLPGGEQNELVICSSLPLAGGASERAVSMSQAIAQALDEQETIRFGDESYTLRYVSMDDTSPETGSWDTAQEARNARAAIAEHGCLVYIGTYNSGAAKIAIPILNRVQMPMISPGNTAAGLTKPDIGLGDEPWIYSPLGPERRNYCRVVPADDLQTPAAAQYAASELGALTVAIFHDTELYGEGLSDLFIDAARSQGMEIVAGPIGINWRLILQQGSGSSEAREVAAELLAGGPDLVYFGGVSGHGAGEVLASLREQGYKGYFMGADGIADESFIGEARGTADDRIFATLVGTPLEQLPEAGQQWIARYRQRYGTHPDAFAAPSYEAALVVLDAIERAEAPPRGERFLEQARRVVLAEMKATADFNGILGTWSFDENCDTTDTTISINRVQDGEFVLIDTVQSEE